MRKKWWATWPELLEWVRSLEFWMIIISRKRLRPWINWRRLLVIGLRRVWKRSIIRGLSDRRRLIVLRRISMLLLILMRWLVLNIRLRLPICACKGFTLIKWVEALGLLNFVYWSIKVLKSWWRLNKRLTILVVVLLLRLYLLLSWYNLLYSMKRTLLSYALLLKFLLSTSKILFTILDNISLWHLNRIITTTH